MAYSSNQMGLPVRQTVLRYQVTTPEGESKRSSLRLCMRLSSVQKGSETLRLTYVKTRQENQQAEVPRHHLAAKLNLIAPSKAATERPPKEVRHDTTCCR